MYLFRHHSINISPARRTGPGRERRQILHGFACEVKQSLFRTGGFHLFRFLRRKAAVFRDGQTHDDFPRASHQLGENPVLNGRKTREAVKNNHALCNQCRGRNRLGEQVHRLLRRDKPGFLLLQKALVQKPQIRKPRRQCALPALSRKFLQNSDLFRCDVVLHKLGDHGFDLRNHPQTPDTAGKHAQFILFLFGDPPQKKALSDIIQHRPRIRSRLLENPVRKPPERQNIDVHDPVARAGFHQFLLRLHGILVRHHEEDVFLVPRHRKLLKICTFPGAGGAEAERKSHSVHHIPAVLPSCASSCPILPQVHVHLNVNSAFSRQKMRALLHLVPGFFKIISEPIAFHLL